MTAVGVGTPMAVGLLDVSVADRLGELLGVHDRVLLAALALAVAAPRAGHVCVDLAAVTGEVSGRDGTPLFPDGPPGPSEWAAALVGSALAREPGDHVEAPLVVDGTRCYLDRYWAHEDALRAAVLDRSEVAPPSTAHVEAVRAVLDVVASASTRDDRGVDRQRLAVANALLRPLSVLSGGPGTGKTHTVVSVLAGHLLLAASRGARPPRLAVAAPTGKAAARMEEAIREGVRDRGLPEEVSATLLGLEGRTLHRLLGYRWHAPTRFRHDARDPLPHDVVVVDEASMVALGMTRRLVEAVRPDATLVLVGDRDQLTSVEAGAVLGDLCGPRAAAGARSLRLSAPWAAVLGAATREPVAAGHEPMPTPGVWDAVVHLERYHRFGAASGIGAVATAVRAAGDDGQHVLDLLAAGAAGERAPALFHDDVALLPPADGALPAHVRDLVLGAAAPYLAAADDGDAGAALAALDDLRLLCATREGPLGVTSVTATVEAWLAASEPARGIGRDRWYVGRPVLVTRNDPDLGLMNGDVGVTLARGDRRVVAFPHGDGVREVAAVRLPPHETVWALTIHKSQGSQFRHAVVVLPEHDTRVLSRELVYTGVTRARERLTVVAADDVLRTAVQRPVRRATGLADRLWPSAEPG